MPSLTSLKTTNNNNMNIITITSNKNEVQATHIIRCAGNVWYANAPSATLQEIAEMHQWIGRPTGDLSIEPVGTCAHCGK